MSTFHLSQKNAKTTDVAHNPTNLWKTRIKAMSLKQMSAAMIKSPAIAKPAKKSRKERRKEKEVAALQERSACILPATTFKRIVTQEAANHSSERLRFNADAVNALQVAAEQEITRMFQGADFCAQLGKRDTVTVQDIRNYQALRTIG